MVAICNKVTKELVQIRNIDIVGNEIAGELAREETLSVQNVIMDLPVPYRKLNHREERLLYRQTNGLWKRTKVSNILAKQIMKKA